MVVQADLWARVSALTPRRVKAARLELGLSQEAFARLIGSQARQRGMTPSLYSVSRWERGVKQPGVLWGPTLLRIVEESEARRAQRGEHT